jgi:hypothetical protein
MKANSQISLKKLSELRPEVANCFKTFVCWKIVTSSFLLLFYYLSNLKENNLKEVTIKKPFYYALM